MTVVALYIASFGIGPNMAFYALCSVFISVMIFEYGIKSGLLVYLAAGIVGVLIIPDKFGIIIYGIGFGVYPVVKFLLRQPLAYRPLGPLDHLRDKG